MTAMTMPNDGDASELSYKDAELRAYRRLVKQYRDSFEQIIKTTNNLSVVDIAVKALKMRAEGWE